jgi:hypothetical protein
MKYRTRIQHTETMTSTLNSDPRPPVVTVRCRAGQYKRAEPLSHTADPREKAAHDRCFSSRAPKGDSGPWSRVYAQNS